MTMLVTDLSRLVPAPIEPRGFAGANILPLPGQFAAMQLHSLAAGGIFIERIMLRGQAPTAAESHRADVSTLDLGLPPGFQINIGGTPVRSLPFSGSTLIPSSGVLVPSPTDPATIVWEFGMFVPNQAFFWVQPELPDVRLDVAMIYRELPSVEEIG